jgi:hypothetical protein
MKHSLAVIALGVSGLCAVFGLTQKWDDEWRVKPSDDPGKIHFSVERLKPGSHWNMSSDMPLDQFRGLTRETVEKGGKAKFEYVRDAGRLVCEGYFKNGYGIGAFEFIQNTQYSDELQRLGYQVPDERELFSMTMSDVSLEFARGVKSANVPATTKQLLEMRIHGIKLEYIQQMRAAGYTELAAKDFIEMKIHGVTPDLVAELKKAGYDLPAKKVVEMKIHGVSPAYIKELNSYGLKPDASQIVEMKIHGVQTEFVQEARNLGFSFTPRELTELRIHGVNGPYLRQLKNSGFRDLTADKIVKLKIHGID